MIKFFLGILLFSNSLINDSGSVTINDTILAYQYYKYSDSLYSDPELSLVYAELAIPLLLRTNQLNEYLYMLNSKSYLFQSLEEYDSMEMNNIFALSEAERLVDYSHVAYSSALNNLGRVHQIKGDYANAIGLYQKGLGYLTKLKSINPNVIGTIYENLGLIYRNKGDYTTAIEHFNSALLYHKIHFANNMAKTNKGHPKIGKVHQFKASCYMSLGDLKSATESLSLSHSEFQKLGDHKDSYLSYWYKDKARLLIKQQNYSEALAYADTGLRLKKLLPFERSSLLLLKAEAYHQLHNYQLAINITSEAINLAPDRMKGHQVKIQFLKAKSHIQLGNIQSTEKVYNSISEVLQIATFENGNSQVDSNYYMLPEIVTYYKEQGVFQTEIYHQTDNLQELKKGLEFFVKMINVHQELANSYYADESKWLSLKNSKSYLALAMAAAWEMYEVDKKIGFEHLLFFSDQSKSILLNIQRQKNRSLQNIQDVEIRKLEKEIRACRSILNVLSENSDKRSIYEDRLFAARRDLIKQNRKNIKTTKHAIETPTEIIKQAKKILDQKTLLYSYYTHDSLLYTIKLSSSGYNAIKHVSQTHFKSIDTLYHSIMNHRPITSIIENLKFILPDTSNQLTSHYIIIPDEKTSNLSFELLTDYNSTNSNPKSISYGYSISTLSDQYIQRESEYTRSTFIQQSISEEERYSNYEFDQIGDLFTSTYKNQEAKVEPIIESLESSKLIHFSSHSSKGDFAMNSSIQLWDTSLFEHDIYALNLSNDLTVLSGCESALGTILIGEGVSSLGRAFTAAGSASVLSSLWKINEKSTADIIISFYKYLKQGHTKSYALAQAKRDYLNSDIPEYKKHPYYWAGLILNGNDAPLEFESGSSLTAYWWVLVLGLISFITVFKLKGRTG